jgi:hypothetical protein
MKNQTSAPLLAAFAKVKRAEAHIRDLHGRIDAFHKAHPYEVLSEINAEGTEEIWYFRIGSEFPEELRVDIGTVLHLLRSPLDQAVCAIALLEHSTPEGVMFPFGATSEKFEKAFREQKKLPPRGKRADPGDQAIQGRECSLVDSSRPPQRG